MNARMLHGILVLCCNHRFTQAEIHVQNLVCPKSCFSPKNGYRKSFVEISTKLYFSMAERVGFEPTVAHHH
ncbi:hypothetical protein, partial [Selenomonas noxia]|uniref:hypothetical protein n=1 Tax=Selenomonas noxia TaxID=135083 RepID=UPI0028F047F8